MSEEYPNLRAHIEIAAQVKAKFGLDEIDMQILGVLIEKWAQGKQPRVTDVTIHWGKDIAAPASIHWRLNKDMVNQRFVQLVASTEDARVKFVVPGPRMATLQKFIAAQWDFSYDGKDSEPTKQIQLELPLGDL